MKKHLSEISKTSIILADFEFPQTFVQTNWLGAEPATDKQLIEVENRLGLKLPEDYKTFLKLCNGFQAPNSIEPTFHPAHKIDYLENLDPDLSRIWIETGNPETGSELRRSILVAGFGEEQYFLLLPPTETAGWRYWKFASWIPGEEEYEDLETYWIHLLGFNRYHLNKPDATQ